jgi:glycerol uptake facilitator-like aquaporin
VDLHHWHRLKFDALKPDFGLPRLLVAEALGAYVLVLASAGPTSSFGTLAAATVGPAQALAPGLALLVLVLLFGLPGLGGFNPAVTLGLVLGGRLAPSRLLPSWLAQFGGALAAGFTLRLLLRSSLLGTTNTHMPGLAALALEALLTAWLVWVFLASTEREVPLLHAALAVAATLSMAIFWAAPLSGASMNPARSLGPALAAGDLSDLWIYLLGPFLGAVLGAKAYLWYRRLA